MLRSLLVYLLVQLFPLDKSPRIVPEKEWRHFSRLLMYIAKLLSKSKTIPISTPSNSEREYSFPPHPRQHWLESRVWKMGAVSWCSLYSASSPPNSLEYRCSINQSKLQTSRHYDLIWLFWVATNSSPVHCPVSWHHVAPIKGGAPSTSQRGPRLH